MDHPQFADVSPSLREYVTKHILPRYRDFDAAHRQDHALTVMKQCMELNRFYHLNPDMLYAIAAYHDTGLCHGRELHHLHSGKIIRADQRLRRWFSTEEIETMACAAEDHRASSRQAPRSIYGQIVAEADRIIVPNIIVERTVLYGLDHHPGLTREEHYQRTRQHLEKKYGEKGYLKLWIPESPNVQRLAELRQLLSDEPRLRALFTRLYEKHHA